MGPMYEGLSQDHSKLMKTITTINNYMCKKLDVVILINMSKLT